MTITSYLCRINSKAALLGTLTLLAIDVYLFKLGLSWTPLHYESLAPLLVMSRNQGRAQIFAAIACTLLFGIVEILYFTFGLSLLLVSESWIFLILAPAAVLIYIYPMVLNVFTNRQFPIILLITASGLLIADKKFSRDTLSSSYLTHFFKLGVDAYSTPSPNIVYKKIKNQISKEQGGILVVFESLGVSKNRSALAELIITYPDFNFITLKHEGGSTVSAEIRYLCGVNGNINDFSSCIPRNIPSQSMHGNTLKYFNRHILYHDMGFDKISGRHELNELTTCDYSYHAVCDRALRLKLIQDIDETNCRGLHYLLTIDSHFPYTKYANHSKGLYSDLSEWLEAMRVIIKKHPNCQIFIAGDHPPPLSHDFDFGQILLITTRH